MKTYSLKHMVRISVLTGLVLLLSHGLSVPASAQGVMFVQGNNVGIGTATPSQSLHVYSTDQALVLVETAAPTTATRTLFKLINNGKLRFTLEDTNSGINWNFQNDGIGNFVISKAGSGGQEFTLDGSGNLTIAGDITTASCSPCVSDYVFAPGYDLMPLAELGSYIEDNGHLPNVPSEAEYQERGGVALHEMQVKLLEKIEELTLYTLQQQELIDQLMAERETRTQRQDDGD